MAEQPKAFPGALEPQPVDYGQAVVPRASASFEPLTSRLKRASDALTERLAEERSRELYAEGVQAQVSREKQGIAGIEPAPYTDVFASRAEQFTKGARTEFSLSEITRYTTEDDQARYDLRDNPEAYRRKSLQLTDQLFKNIRDADPTNTAMLDIAQRVIATRQAGVQRMNDDWIAIQTARNNSQQTMNNAKIVGDAADQLRLNPSESMFGIAWDLQRLTADAALQARNMTTDRYTQLTSPAAHDELALDWMYGEYRLALKDMAEGKGGVERWNAVSQRVRDGKFFINNEWREDKVQDLASLKNKVKDLFKYWIEFRRGAGSANVLERMGGQLPWLAEFGIDAMNDDNMRNLSRAFAADDIEFEDEMNAIYALEDVHALVSDNSMSVANMRAYRNDVLAKRALGSYKDDALGLLDSYVEKFSSNEVTKTSGASLVDDKTIFINAPTAQDVWAMDTVMKAPDPVLAFESELFSHRRIAADVIAAKVFGGDTSAVVALSKADGEFISKQTSNAIAAGNYAEALKWASIPVRFDADMGGRRGLTAYNSDLSSDIEWLKMPVAIGQVDQEAAVSFLKYLNTGKSKEAQKLYVEDIAGKEADVSSQKIAGKSIGDILRAVQGRDNVTFDMRDVIRGIALENQARSSTGDDPVDPEKVIASLFTPIAERMRVTNGIAYVAPEDARDQKVLEQALERLTDKDLLTNFMARSSDQGGVDKFRGLTYLTWFKHKGDDGRYRWAARINLRMAMGDNALRYRNGQPAIVRFEEYGFKEREVTLEIGELTRGVRQPPEGMTKEQRIAELSELHKKYQTGFASVEPDPNVKPIR